MINIDEVGTKALTTAVGVFGPRIAAAATKPRGRRADDLSIARWFETYRLTAEFPDLPGLSPSLAERLADLLRGDDTQAALQELLAARLTDADDVEARRAREVFCLTLSTADPDIYQFGPPLAEFYDDQISALVARLEAAEPAMLAQIRSEAMSARMIAILRAVERHTAALAAPSERAYRGIIPAPDLIAVSAARAAETAIKSIALGTYRDISNAPARMSRQCTTRKPGR